MNKENASQFLPLVQALADGKTIQVLGCDGSEWIDIREVKFSDNPEAYRIKPEPREFWLFRDDPKNFYNESDTKPSGKWNELIKVREILD